MTPCILLIVRSICILRYTVCKFQITVIWIPTGKETSYMNIQRPVCYFVFPNSYQTEILILMLIKSSRSSGCHFLPFRNFTSVCCDYRYFKSRRKLELIAVSGFLCLQTGLITTVILTAHKFESLCSHVLRNVCHI
jgi:hypothetical protein